MQAAQEGCGADTRVSDLGASADEALDSRYCVNTRVDPI